MSNILASVQPNASSRTVFRALENRPLVLPQTDYRKLQDHLEDCDSTSRSGSTLLAYVLANKLMNARAVADLPFVDVAIGGSEVAYAIDGALPCSGLLVHSARPGAPGGVIAVASLLGATLIGMRVGERAPLLNEDGGIATVSVVSIVSPSSAAKDERPRSVKECSK
ncbi:MAG TPA: hypothetical protein DC031_00295 [Sulfitobacter sp.]|uniref:hypothetical protein n=1 Tax=Sulfitobacter dubius TaxID=218673 RepID=UPI000C6A04DB|nr:hypothetical protein [Sulfitobacter sp.]HBB81726.1 hypothetical protein [Sulfitobacter sp.]